MYFNELQFNSHSQFCERKMSAAIFLQLFVITLLSLPYFSVEQSPPKDYACSTKVKCDECIRTYGCVWCSDPNAIFEKRCQRQGESKCAAGFLMDPKIEVITVQADPLTEEDSRLPSGGTHGSDVSWGSSHETIRQITPQHLRLKIRPNKDHPVQFNLTYRLPKDYPVDLYYLMDLSKSMEDDKDKLSSLGDTLAKTMREMTRDFRLGFGSFVDKVAMPYVSVVPKNLNSPCPGCAAPYGFRNVMPLSQDTSGFAGRVKLASVSGNLDAPEGGFDAIMQAIVCPQEIGWRQTSRKLLVFSTDSSFHYAGDGKLAGIIKPNDGCCHMDSFTHLYTHSLQQDYPSVSQIDMKVKENSMNLIFAVTNSQHELYKELSRNIQGSSCGVLNEDSANVVELVKEQYQKITSAIEMRDHGVSDNLRVRYFTRCRNATGNLVELSKCDGLKVGEKVDFQIDVELLSCPSDSSKWNQTFTIYPVGVGENLTVDVELQCDCSCNNPLDPSFERNSPRCSGHGTLKCGVCDCDENFSGEDCNCTTDADKIDNCRPNSDATLLCSNHGTCKCNKCICDTFSETQRFWGQYCECNNFTCPLTGGKLCSDHGDCVCGACICHKGWIGDDCACEDSITNCRNTEEDEICSGHGKCVCNKCECDAAGEYSGKFCDKCPTCNTKCEELKDCVLCRAHSSGPLSQEECNDINCPYNITIIDTVEGLVKDEYNYCTKVDDQDCKFDYIYEVHGKRIDVLADRNLKCPPQARILGVVFSVILSIVLIGLAFLLMWKFFTSMRDRREFAKFEKERMMAKWDSGQNPIYKQATSTFKNPTYCGT